MKSLSKMKGERQKEVLEEIINDTAQIFKVQSDKIKGKIYLYYFQSAVNQKERILDRSRPDRSRDRICRRDVSYLEKLRPWIARFFLARRPRTPSDHLSARLFIPSPREIMQSAMQIFRAACS